MWRCGALAVRCGAVAVCRLLRTAGEPPPRAGCCQRPAPPLTPRSAARSGSGLKMRCRSRSPSPRNSFAPPRPPVATVELRCRPRRERGRPMFAVAGDPSEQRRSGVRFASEQLRRLEHRPWWRSTTHDCRLFVAEREIRRDAQRPTRAKGFSHHEENASYSHPSRLAVPISAFPATAIAQNGAACRKEPALSIY